MCEKWKPDRLVKNRTEVDKKYWLKAIDELVLLVDNPKELVINFGGGEALMRCDLLEIIAYAVEKGFTTNLASNGWLIDEVKGREIALSGLHSINLSLDSLNPELHDRMRGMPGVYERVISAVKHLRRYSKKLEIGICSVIYDININEIIPLVKWVGKNSDINWIVFMAAMQPNNTEIDKNWHNDGKYLFLFPRRKWKAAFLIQKIKFLKWCGYKIQNPYFQLDAFAKYFLNPDKFVRVGRCNMDKAVHISAVGDIYLCYRHGCLGNIQRDSLSEVWLGKESFKVREDIEKCKSNCHFLLNCYFEKEYPFEYLTRVKHRKADKER